MNLILYWLGFRFSGDDWPDSVGSEIDQNDQVDPI